VSARENLLSRFNFRDQFLNLSIPPGVVLFEGDIITQQKQVQTFEGGTKTVSVKGVIVKIAGNDVTVKQLTFEPFEIDEPIFKSGSSIAITVNLRQRDFSSLPLGLNADIKGNVEIVTGRIQEIEVIDSGIGYEDGSIVNIINITKENNQEIDALGIAETKRQGITEGRWDSFFSHINREKVLQDSFFYQDYSYQITTDIDQAIYKNEYMDLMHPAGLKMFSAFSKTDIINMDIDILEPSISRVIMNDLDIITENNGAIISENGFQYLLQSETMEGV
jgi:uncharacterized protein YdeI (BOF family)